MSTSNAVPKIVQQMLEEHSSLRAVLIQQTRERRAAALTQPATELGDGEAEEEGTSRRPAAAQVTVYACGDPSNEADPRGGIVALRTKWAGVPFDSRVEARIAILFSTLGLRWVREPAEIDLGRYLQRVRAEMVQDLASGRTEVAPEEDSLVRILFQTGRSSRVARPDFMVHFADGPTLVEVKPSAPSVQEMARAEAVAYMGFRYAIAYGSKFTAPYERQYQTAVATGNAIRWMVWEAGSRSVAGPLGSVLVTDATDKLVSFSHLHSAGDLDRCNYGSKLMRSAWCAARNAFRKA